MEKNLQLLRNLALINYDFTYLISNMNEIAKSLPLNQQQSFHQFMLQFLISSNEQIDEIIKGNINVPTECENLYDIDLDELLIMLGMKDPSLRNFVSSLLNNFKCEVKCGNIK